MKNESLFSTAPVWKVLLKTSLPSMVTILVMMVYNMADMFFIGQTGDAMQVAAVSLVGPVMSILSGFGTLVGSGGCAAIATALGKKDVKNVRAMASFCCYAGLAMGVVFTAVVLLAKGSILGAIGASENTAGFAGTYLSIIALGAPVMMFSSTFGNVIRAEGAAKQSMLGNGLGSVVNIVLDPLFILALNMGVAGAAIATVIGHAVTSVYYLWYMARGSALSVRPRDFTLRREVSLQVLALGLPTALGVMLMSLSTIIMNNVMVRYGDIVIAAKGVSGKVTMLVSMLQMGLCMGVQPVIAYNYGAGNLERMRRVVKVTGWTAVVMGTSFTVLVLLARSQLVTWFVDDAEVLFYGQRMVVASVITGPIYGLCNLATTFFQSTGKALYATIVSLLRQGLVFVPVIFLLDFLGGLDWVIYAHTVADIVATALALCLFVRHYKKITGGARLALPVG